LEELYSQAGHRAMAKKVAAYYLKQTLNVQPPTAASLHNWEINFK